MQDFNDYVKNNKQSPNGVGANGIPQGLMNLVSSLASKYDGKNTNELIKAVYDEAKKGKQNGTLTNSDIDNFATMLAPVIDQKKRKTLYKIVDELKRI
jgi:hypothetical protein